MARGNDAVPTAADAKPSRRARRWWEPLLWPLGALVVLIVILLGVEKVTDIGSDWVGVAGALGGAVIGYFIDAAKTATGEERRSLELEDERKEARELWHRERRYAAYETAIRAQADVDSALMSCGVAESPGDVEAAAAELEAALKVLNQIISYVAIFGSPAVNKIFNDPPENPAGAMDWIAASQRMTQWRVETAKAIADEARLLSG